MKYILILFAYFFFFQNLSSQDYNKIDEIVKNYPSKFKSIEQLANRIKKDFNTDLEKTRAAYYWISNNITYDYKSFLKGTNGYYSIKISDRNYEKEIFALEKEYARKVLKKKTGVCEGYAQLLKFTLTELGVEAYVISGYAKTNSRQIGRIKNTPNHAWNGVKINGEWKLIDATWSTGNTEKNPTTFNFNDTYFFIDPKKMILNHFPKNNKWQLLESPISKKTFFSSPLFLTNYFNSNLILNKKTEGIIKVKNNDTIKLFFDKGNLNKFYTYEFVHEKYSEKFLFKKIDEKYIAEIPFSGKRNSVLTIFNDNKSILEFNIIVKK